MVVDLCNEFSQAHDVTLLLLKDVSHFYLPQLSPSVKVIEAKMPLGGSVKQLLQCCRWVKKINPDVVHIHSHARYNMLLANILYGHRYKFYLTIHSDVRDHYSHGWSGLQVRLSGCLGRTKFVTISPTNFRQFQAAHPRLKQMLIPNGRALPSASNMIDDVRKEMNSYRQKGQGLLFIHIGRCNPCKNQSMLVDSFNELIAEGMPLSLVIVGAGFDSELGQSIRAKASADIHFVGAKDNVYDYLSCADAFCLSSDYEGMPITLIEAHLSGKPIISTPVSGAVDIIQDGENGILSRGHTKEEYKEAIRRFVQSKDNLCESAEQGKYKGAYAIQTCAAKYLEWFSN